MVETEPPPDSEQVEGTHTDDSAPRPRTRDVLSPGEDLGRYRIAEVLGAGGVGVVYRARDPDLNRDVAIKVLQAATEGTPPAKDHEQRLLREAQAMARLSHANIVTVFDVGTFRGRVFLAMEYIDGGTLKQWLRTGGRGWRERLDAVIAAGRGLAEAHRAGVIHRDFKPDNVLVSKRGVAQVVDFGLARSLDVVEGAGREPDDDALSAPDNDALDIQLTRTGAVLGTPAYMSPEQFHGREVDARSDQFSFAVVAFEALWGMRPFPGVTAHEVMRSVDTGKALQSPAGGEVPAAIGPVIARGLRADPADRFASMDDFLVALTQAADAGAMASTSRRRWAPLVAVVLALAAVALVTVALVRRSDDKASATVPTAGPDPAPPFEPPVAPAPPIPPAPPGWGPMPLPPDERGGGRVRVEVDGAEPGDSHADWPVALEDVPDDVRAEILAEIEAELGTTKGDDVFEAKVKKMVLEAIKKRVKADKLERKR